MAKATEAALSNSDYSSEEGEELTEYEYKTLVEPHNVRILNLRPGGTEASEVVCELVDENLDQIKNKYEALSWSWGTREWDHRVHIHHRGKDFVFKVPASLASALKALRRVKRVRRLWIDAICIYSYRTATKHLRNLRFMPPFSEGFDFVSERKNLCATRSTALIMIPQKPV
jgi:hypothetical protein